MTHLAMDNFEFTMTGYGSVPLKAALACVGYAHSKISGYSAGFDGDQPYIWFSWTEVARPLTNSLPVDLHPVDLLGIIEIWLQDQKYPREPDHDGSNSKGWRITTAGKDGEWHRAFKVTPEWAWHGK